MNKIWIAALAVCGLLAGCSTASTPVTFADSKPVPANRLVAHYKPEPGTYPVQIKRDLDVNWSCMYRLDIDGKKSAFIAEGEKLTLFLQAGQHVLNVERVMTDTLKPSDILCTKEEPLEFPLIVEQRTNKYRLYNTKVNTIHFSPTATD